MGAQEVVQCRTVRPQPGDCLVVEAKGPLTPQQAGAIQRAVHRWAGGTCQVLVVDMSQLRLRHMRGAGSAEALLGPLQRAWQQGQG